ncbi:Uncharacterised protein [Edwardsiella hoshinae]|uniref:Uncharacterized protein n=1 Tax=Edwardsiella hoshinae TaxID=93378 RepID=A0A376D8P4_9GAMM|nr:Uncharacterised protein [Edwardsiella hoshinae]
MINAIRYFFWRRSFMASVAISQGQLAAELAISYWPYRPTEGDFYWRSYTPKGAANWMISNFSGLSYD